MSQTFLPNGDLRPIIGQEELRKIFVLNPHTGKFKRRLDRYGQPYHPSEESNIVKGTKISNGSLRMMVHGRFYAYHRLVWLYVHGVNSTDCYLNHEIRIGHLDGDRTNNRPDNLAEIKQGKRELPSPAAELPSFL